MIEEIKNFSFETHKDMLLNMGGKLLVVIAVIALMPFVKKVLFFFMFKAETGKKLDKIHIPVLKSILTYVLYILAALIVLDAFGVNTAGLLAVLGAAGLAIGLALKDTLGNIASGFVLLFVRPFSLNDYIEGGNNVAGSVEQITLFVTTLRTPDGQYVSVPNSILLSNAIKNYSRNKTRRIRIMVRIAHKESIEQAIEVLTLIAANERRFLEDPAPQVVIMELAETGTQMELRGWVKTPEYWDVFFDLNKEAKEKLAKKGISMAVQRMEMLAPIQQKKTEKKKK